MTMVSTVSCFSTLNIEGQRESELNFYRHFPWIGIYQMALQANGHKRTIYILLAFTGLVAVFYCLYICAIFILINLMFKKSMSIIIPQLFYAFLTFMEAIAMVLLRTRSSIKWFPRFNIVLIMCFLYYVENSAYGFTKNALLLLFMSTIAFFLYHLRTFEIPALEWNPYHHYTPTHHSPRTLFVPIFSLAWYRDLPPLWTMFYPLFGRSYFTSAQLALVDQNNALLSQALENVPEGVNLIQQGGRNENQSQGGRGEASENSDSPPSDMEEEGANNMENSQIELVPSHRIVNQSSDEGSPRGP